MSEFLVALAVLLPMFLAVTYAGRYGDILQSSVQASRYAAFERVMQPDTGRLTQAKLQDQMRARFFVQGSYLHQGLLQSDDTAVGLGDKGLPSLWRDLSFAPLLKTPDDVSLTFADAPLNAGAVQASMNIMAKTAGHSWTPAKVARVEVNLVNKLDLSDTPKPLLTLAAATATAPDGFGSGGSSATRKSASTGVVSSYVPPIINKIIGIAMFLFEPWGPEFGCIKADAVPHDRLQPFSGVGDCTP